MSELIKCKILDIEPDGTATVKFKIDSYKFVHQQIKEVFIETIDSRPLSENQRKMCYALINAIAEFTGNERQTLKEYFKLEFWTNHLDTLNDKIFSLSNAPMSLVAEFQKFLIDFIIENDIPTKQPLLEYVDDIEKYIFACLIHKKCVVCGKIAELHHIDTIGMGADRTEAIHIGKEAISLCREHHTEFHTIGKTEFFNKYHFDKGILIDRTIAKIYGLKV